VPEVGSDFSRPAGESATTANASVQLKRCTEADIDELNQWAQCYYSEDHIEFEPQRFNAALRGAMASDRGAAFWLYAHGKHAGYAIVLDGWSVEYGGLAAELDELYVAPEFRGRGVASAALEALKAHCKTRGVVIFSMETTPDNARAQALYQKRGFAPTQRPVFRAYLA
jgi:ribosomal protein S18 acetylase RimI-like enzyme